MESFRVRLCRESLERQASERPPQGGIPLQFRIVAGQARHSLFCCRLESQSRSDWRLPLMTAVKLSITQQGSHMRSSVQIPKTAVISAQTTAAPIVAF